MKRTINIVILFLSILLLQIACSDEFLNPKPLSFYAPENVYLDKKGFETALVTVRRNPKQNEFYENLNHLDMDIHGSEMGIRQTAGDWRTLTPSGSHQGVSILPIFQRFYNYIRNTNVIINRIDQIQWDRQEERNQILGEALFYRSYWYYRLTHTFGDVPFIDYEIDRAKLDFYSHSKLAILRQIQKDLEFAARWLPETTLKDRPSKYTALHLLAKIYLVNLEFDKAIEAATDVINGPYALMTQRFGKWQNDNFRNVIWDLHWPENKALGANTEAIWIIVDRAEAPENAKTGGTGTMRSHNANWHGQLVRDSKGLRGTIDLNPDGTRTAMHDTLGRGNPNITPSPYATFDIWAEKGYYFKNTPDLRRANCNWIDYHLGELKYNNPASDDYGKPINIKYFARLSDSLTTIFPFPIYKTWYPHEEGYTGNVNGGNGDRYIFRLAETYLIRAEAYYWKNQPGLAANDINVVRTRANALPVTAGEVTIDYIFDERARELFLEEMRHTELIRASLILAQLNRDGYTYANLAQKNWWYDRLMSTSLFYQKGEIRGLRFYTEPHNLFWPIDITIITTNTLGVINQNAGYDGAEFNVPPLETIEATPY